MEYRRLSDQQLQQILAEEPVDVVRRLEAKAEIERRRRSKRKPWSRNEKIALASAILAALSLVVALITVPSFRAFLGDLLLLHQSPDSHSPATAPSTKDGPQPEAKSPKSSPADVGRLSGLWAGTDRADRPLFYRFLNGGKIRISARLNDPRPVVSPNIRWHLSGDQLLMEWSEGGQVTDIYIGTVGQDYIIGRSHSVDTRFPEDLDKISD